MTVSYNQSGYIGSSYSVRAGGAEREGRRPLSRGILRLAAHTGITQAQARELLEEIGPCEAHHVSKYANLVDYYDIDDAIELAKERYELTNEMIDARLARREQIQAKAAATREAKKLAAKLEAEKKEAARREVYLDECKKNKSLTLTTRCSAMKITKEKITEAMAAGVPADPCGIVAQIKKWFEGYSVEEAVAYGI
ncbi:MAG: hypothetical protein ABSB91_00215 [Sedimentisphaerales bacterium]|jgi:hypothetical protein